MSSFCLLILHVNFVVKSQCCRISGDPHYYTFDGEDIHYQGAPCDYDLSSGSCGGKSFRVHAGNEYRNGRTHVAWLRYIEVRYNGYTIHIGRNRMITVCIVNNTHK